MREDGTMMRTPAVSYTHLVKEVKRARLTEYAAAKSSAEYHAKENGEHGVWQYKVCLLYTSRCV